jgi:uncharacterized protein
MPTYRTPGVYKEDIFLRPTAELRTGVPAFLGLAGRGAFNTPQKLNLWSDFEVTFGAPLPGSYLAYAVHGFFANRGDLCYVVRLQDDSLQALVMGLNALAQTNDFDLLCAPDIIRLRREADLPPLEAFDNQVWQGYLRRLLDRTGLSPDPDDVLRKQREILRHCDTVGDRFAILDTLPSANVSEVLEQRQGLGGTNGALYYPWIRVVNGPALAGGFIPPCGHVAGIYARSDHRAGVHKAPANEVLEGVLDLEVDLTDAQQGDLNPSGINVLRVFRGRGIRVWGARTLSADANWTYINVRRLFLTAGRWIERNMADVLFEPHDPRLWSRIVRELNAYFRDLFQRGALKGNSPEEAFYVKCDADTNPPDGHNAEVVVTEIGLAPALPNEFVVVRIIHGARGTTITGPARPQ